MKNKLLITTALVAVLSTANVYARTIDSNDNNNQPGQEQGFNTTNPSDLADNELIINDTAVYAQFDYEIDNTKKIEINSSRLDIGGSDLSLSDPALKITGGEVVVNGLNRTENQDVALFGKGIDMSGGKITLNNGSLTDDSGTGDDPSEVARSLNISGGEITMNTTGTGWSAFGSEGDQSTGGIVNISGGKITVNGGLDTKTSQIEGSNFLLGKEINMSGGELNINSGANLKTIIGNDITKKATIKLTDAGIINLSGGLWADIDGDGSLNFKNSNALLDGNVTGSNLSFDANHSLSNAISGTIGDLASLNVNSGLLNYDKQTGKITDLNIKDGAGLNIGTKTVNATSVDFADNSSLNFQVSGLDNHGKIVADDITIGTTGTNLNLTLDTGVLAKDKTETFTILDSSNITGAFANLSKNARYEFVDNGDGTFDITGKATASDVVVNAGGNANNAGTAAAWDNSMPAQASATAKSVQGALNNLSQTNPQAYVAALTALAPEANGATASTSVEGANQVFGAVGTRLSGGSVSGSKQGMSSGDNYLDKGAMWVQGLFNKAKLDKANGFDSDSNGLAFGAEKQINDDVKLGVGYAYSNTDIDSIGRKTDVDTHTAIAYGEYKPSNWYVNGIATYSWGSYDENKNVAGLGVKSKYDVDSIGLQAMTGYDFNTNIAKITPEVGMRYVNIKQDGYKDSADQRVASKTDDVWTGVAGVKLAKDFALENGMTITPEARFALTYDMTQADSASVVTLANGSVYSADASPLKRFGQEVGLGLTADVNDNVELNVGYEGKFRSDYTDHTGMFNAKYKF